MLWGALASERHLPATILAHQALVLPLKVRWPRRFSGVALVLGSMAPDLEFIARLDHDWLVSHTVEAQLWFTVPVTMGLTWLVTAQLVPHALPYLRDAGRWRLHDLAALRVPQGWRGWGSVAMSGWVGGMSHVLLDGITHGNHSGWLVPYLPWLRMPVPHPGGAAPLHDALQLWGTVVGIVVALRIWRRIAHHRLLWVWRGEVPPPSMPRRPRAQGMRLLRLTGGAAAAGLLLGACTHLGGSHKAVGAAALFGAVDAAVLALVAWCGVRGRAKGGVPGGVRRGQRAGPPVTPWRRFSRSASPTA